MLYICVFLIIYDLPSMGAYCRAEFNHFATADDAADAAADGATILASDVLFAESSSPAAAFFSAAAFLRFAS